MGRSRIPMRENSLPDTGETLHRFKDGTRPWYLDWIYLEEGYSGDYNPSDPDDKPLLRADLSYEGREIDDCSFCTLAPVNTSAQFLLLLSEDLFASLPDDPDEYRQRTMAAWTWRTDPESI